MKNQQEKEFQTFQVFVSDFLRDKIFYIYAGGDLKKRFCLHVKLMRVDFQKTYSCEMYTYLLRDGFFSFSNFGELFFQ